MFEKIDARIEQMEKVQRKKNVVVYNLPESEEEQAKDRYKEDEVSCRKIFEVMEMENIEQKQLIRLGKREYKIRPVLVKLKDEEVPKEVLVKAKRPRFSEQYIGVFISKNLIRVERERKKNLRKELKEVRENETEGEWYEIKNGKILKNRIERRRRGGNGRCYRGGEGGRSDLEWRGKGEWDDSEEGKDKGIEKKKKIWNVRRFND